MELVFSLFHECLPGCIQRGLGWYVLLLIIYFIYLFLHLVIIFDINLLFQCPATQLVDSEISFSTTSPVWKMYVPLPSYSRSLFCLVLSLLSRLPNIETLGIVQLHFATSALVRNFPCWRRQCMVCRRVVRLQQQPKLHYFWCRPGTLLSLT